MSKLKRTAKWHKLITMKELKHLRDGLDRITLRDFWASRKFQVEEKITCFECQAIDRKLRAAGLGPKE